MPYSSAAAIMTARDHPFNHSGRPLLAERKPQLLKKKLTNTKTANTNTTHTTTNNNNNSRNKADRESLKVHGFNDFDIISQKHFNTHHIGYPYGSPPSPTANSNDFVFSDTNTTTTMANNFYNTNTSTPRGGYGGDNEYDDSCNYYSSVAKTTATTTTTTPGRYFEDNFNWRRPPPQLLTTATQNGKSNTNSQMSNTNGLGPFIFGMHPNGRTNTYANDDSATVINNSTSDKYSKNGQVSMSNSDTSSTSRDSGKDSKFLVKNKNKNRKSSKKNSKDKKSNNKENRPNIKCVVVGDGAVGKTNLIVSYLENRFIREHVPTASDIYNAEVMVNDSPVHVTLCDTAGQDTLDPLRELCYPDSNVFVLCYSVVKPETFHSIKTKWAPKFSKTKASLILVGTQSDLRSDIHVLNKLQVQGEKPVAFTDAWDFAASIDAKYIETSSFTQEKVKDVFDTAIWEALLPTTLPPTPPLWKKLLCLV